MHITILTVGSRGDVQPFVALGRELKARGYTVRLATHGIFGELVEGRGLDFYPIEGNPKDILFSQHGQRTLRSGRNTLRFMRRAAKAFEPVLAQLAEDCWLACQDTDAIIFTPFSFFGYDLAKRLSIPAIATCLQPAIRTRHFPSPAFPQGLKLGQAYNWLTHTVSEYGFWHVVQPYLNRWRKETLELPAISVWRDLERRQAPIIHGYSSCVLPKPPDWGERGHVTGFWYLERESEWEAPVELVQFLEDGPPPVYVGFGSMPVPDDISRIVTEALNESRQRGVIVSGWGELKEAENSTTICVADHVPFDWLFPRVAAVVHHGGAGTTAEGLRSGRPTIVCPLAGDQPFWGELVFGLNAGPKPIPMHKLTANNLARAIETAVNDETIRNSALALGEKLRQENGCANAVEIIHQRLAV